MSDFFLYLITSGQTPRKIVGNDKDLLIEMGKILLKEEGYAAFQVFSKEGQLLHESENEV